MEPRLKVKFWGTRGLISAPGPEQKKYGGNTPCIQLLYKEHVIIIDTGFGVSNLGETLLPELFNGTPLTCHIFYTHFHWDHIQGLPFFHPTYFPNATINLYSPVRRDLMHHNLDMLFDGSYSPFSGIDSMPSKINLVPLSGKISIGDLDVEYCTTDHGMGVDNTSQAQCFAYRFTDLGRQFRVSLISDHEARTGATNSALVKFAKNSGLLIHDAQYTEEEYKDRVGWGHSSVRLALSNAQMIEAERTLLTHHDPGRNDIELDKIYAEYKRDAQFKGLNFEFAREEEVYEVPPNAKLAKELA